MQFLIEYVSMRTLKPTRNLTGSQCRDFRIGVICSFLLTPFRILAYLWMSVLVHSTFFNRLYDVYDVLLNTMSGQIRKGMVFKIFRILKMLKMYKKIACAKKKM